MATPNVSAIQENAPEKKELIDFFKMEGWDSVPGRDKDLDMLMKKKNWNRSQINHNF
jgi:hypothetical protein